MKKQLYEISKEGKFILLSLLLIIGRAFDASTTYIYTPDLKTETNILVRLFGVNWTGIIIIQIILSCLVIGLLYFYYFKYSPKTPNHKDLTLKQYISYIYFNDTKSFNQLLYKIPTNKSALLASLGYIISMTLISISYIVGTSTLCLIFIDGYAELYRKYNLPAVLYGLIVVIIIIVSVSFFRGEFRKFKRS